MKCVFCGSDNESSASFCRTCGKDIEVKEDDELSDEISRVLNDDKVALKQDNNSSDRINDDRVKKVKNGGNKSLIISIVIAFIVLVILVLTAAILIINPSPERVFKGSVDKMFGALEKSVLNNGNLSTIDLELTPIIGGISSKSEGLSNIINSFNIKITGWVDSESKKMDYKLITNYKNKQLIGFEAFYDDELYVISKDVFDKPLIGECDVFKSYSSKDAAIILESIKTAVKASFKKEYFDKQKVNVTIDGKTYKALVSTIKLNNKTNKEMGSKVLDKLVNDQKFIQAYANISGKGKKTVKQEMENAKEGMTKANYDDQKVDLSLYTTGIKNDFLKLEIKDEDVSMSVTKTNNNEYIFGINYYGADVSFRVKYNVKQDVKISEPDVSNAIDSTSVTSEEASKALDKIMGSDGFKLFNNDFKALTGHTVEELINSINSTPEGALSYN